MFEHLGLLVYLMFDKMAEHIYKCSFCNSYTLESKCPKCSKKVVLPRPPKFSLEDKYAYLIREVKKEELKKKNLY